MSIEHWSDLAFVSSTLILTGDPNGADQLLEKLKLGDAYGAPRGLALFHLVRGDLEAAKTWFEKAIEQRDPTIIPLLRSELGISLRSSAYRRNLARKLNLSP